MALPLPAAVRPAVEAFVEARVERAEGRKAGGNFSGLEQKFRASSKSLENQLNDHLPDLGGKRPEKIIHDITQMINHVMDPGVKAFPTSPLGL